MNRANAFSASIARLAALGAVAFLAAGCTVFGGAGTARLDGGRLETSSTSASIGPGGATTRSSHTVRELRLPE